LSSKELIQRTDKFKPPEARRRFSLRLNHHRPLARLVGLTAALIIFLVFLPAPMRMAIWDGLLAHQIVVNMLLVFSLLAISLIWTTGQKLDAWVFLLFNTRGAHPKWLDRIMSVITQFGSGLACLGIALAFYMTGNSQLSYELILGTLTLWMMVELVKFIIHRSRPFILLVQARIVGYRAKGRSFPSGHTSQAFFLATLTAQHFHAGIWLVLLLYAAALLVGITRMYVGAHYPRDVLAGAILGSIWGSVGVIVDGYVLAYFGLIK